jgi:hypothetical protein
MAKRRLLQVVDQDAVSANFTNSKDRKLERVLAESPDASRGIARAAEDERFTASLYQTSFDRNVRLLVGRVTFSFPYAHWYRVMLDVGNGEISCCELTETAPHPFGIRNTSPLPPLTRVLVALEEGATFGTIIGCLPKIITAATPTFPDWISQGSGGGIRRERYYNQFPTLFNRMGGVIDFSNGRPIDSLSIGEWGRFSELGGGIHLDPLMMFMRMDELCGFWQFYMDRLFRLCAYNWDFRTSVSEVMLRNDRGEGSEMFGFSPYQWEALGLFSASETASRETSDEDVHYNKPLAKSEPAVDDQQPFFRYERYRGYLGQIEMRHVQLPPADITRSEPAFARDQRHRRVSRSTRHGRQLSSHFGPLAVLGQAAVYSNSQTRKAARRCHRRHGEEL